MDKETQKLLCRRVDGNIGDYLARLRSLNAARLAIQQDIREQESRIEGAMRNVRDNQDPAPPSMGRQRSKWDRRIEDHGELLPQISRENRLAQARADLEAEVRNLEILKSKASAIEREIYDNRRLLDQSTDDFARMRCGEVVGARSFGL